MRRGHLVELRALGPIAQHVIGTTPDPAHGSCTDDVARDLEVDLMHAGVIGWEAVEGSAWSSLRYLDEAVHEPSGRFRNFRDVDGRWLEAIGSEDAHGRAVLALGRAMSEAPDRAFRAAAAGVFRRALTGTVALRALHARSSALIGCAMAAGGDQSIGARPAWIAVGARLAGTLAHDVEPVAASPSWPWPEDSVTYESALIPRALVVAGRWTADRRLLDAGLAVLDWLTRTAVAPAGHLSPVGNRGWWPRGGPRARFDQQPIEAAAFVHAAEAALEATGDVRYLADAERAFGWYLGWNDVGHGGRRRGAWRLSRRARPRRVQRQPGRRVDPRLARGGRADPDHAGSVVRGRHVVRRRAVPPRRRSCDGQLRTSSSSLEPASTPIGLPGAVTAARRAAPAATRAPRRR